MHVNFATRIPAERFPSLLRHSAVRTYQQTDFHDTQLSFLSWPDSVMITGLLAQVLGKYF